jgi:hypothetical protein
LPAAAERFGDRRRPAAELVDGTCRGGDEPVVIGIDEVRLDVLKPGQAAEVVERHGVVEQKLVRNRVDRSLLRHGDIGVGLQVSVSREAAAIAIHQSGSSRRL